MKLLLWISSALCLSPFCIAMQKHSKKLQKYSFPQQWNFKAIAPDVSWESKLSQNKNWQTLEQSRMLGTKLFMLEDLQRKSHKQIAVLKKYKSALESMQQFNEVLESLASDIRMIDPLILFHETITTEVRNTLEIEKLIQQVLKVKEESICLENDYGPHEHLTTLDKQLEKQIMWCNTELKQLDHMMQSFLVCANSCHGMYVKPAPEIKQHLEAFANSFKAEDDPFTNIVVLLSDYNSLQQKIRLNQHTRQYYQTSKEFLDYFFTAAQCQKFLAGIAARLSLSKAIASQHQLLQKKLTKSLRENETIAIQNLSNRIAKTRKQAAHSATYTMQQLDEIKHMDTILKEFSDHIEKSSLVSIALKEIVQKTFQANSTFISCASRNAARRLEDTAKAAVEKINTPAPEEKLFPSDDIEHNIYSAKTIERALSKWKRAISLNMDPKNTCTFDREDGQAPLVAYRVHFVSNSQQSINLSAVVNNLFSVHAFEFCDADNTQQSAQFMLHPNFKLYNYDSKFYLYNPHQDVERAYLVEQMLTECTENVFTNVTSDAILNPATNGILHPQ